MQPQQPPQHQQQQFGISPPQSFIPGVNSYMIGGARFDIPNEYTPIEYVNRGANGVVW